MTDSDDDPAGTDEFPLDVPAVLELTYHEWMRRWNDPLPDGSSVLLTGFDPLACCVYRPEVVRLIGRKVYHAIPASPRVADWERVFRAEWPGVTFSIRLG